MKKIIKKFITKKKYSTLNKYGDFYVNNKK
jgi:hypothetical protein